MKVLFYTTFLTAGGGLEVAAVDYINKFIEKGYEIDLLIDYDFGKENIREKQIIEKVNIKYLKSEKLSRLIYKLRTLGKRNKFYNIFLYILIILSDYILWNKKLKEIKKKNYDVTITFFQYLPSYITKIKKIKHLIFLHGSIEHYFLGMRKYFKKNFGKKLDKFNYICTVSEGLKEQVAEIFPAIEENKVKVIYNPINFKKILDLSDNKKDLNNEEKVLLKSDYICTVCRIDEKEKDVKTLIDTYPELNKEIKNLNLIIIGDGPNKLELENYSKKLKGVYFLGRKINPYIWMRNAEIFILSSKQEGFGLVLVEALLLNKKVISSDCKVGPSEILENGKYGELFEIGNSKELIKKIKKVIKKEEINTKDYIINKFGNGFSELEKVIRSN